MRQFWNDLKQAAKQYGKDRAPRLAAALAYYTIFSIAPLLIIVISVVGLVYGSAEARSQLVGQLQQVIGSDAAGLIETMIQRTAETGSGVIATIIGLLTLLVGATTVFAQLQAALNEIWDVAPDRSQGFMHLLFVRLRGFGLVLALGFLLLVSFVLQAVLNVIVSNFSGVLPASDWIWYLLNLLLTLALVAAVFAAIFRVLPDVDLTWNDVWKGALVTAVLFKIGESLIGLYLGASGVRSTYGAAGSLVVLLLWIYFSAQILLFGAEFTKANSRRRGNAGLSSGTEPNGLN